MEKQQEGVQYLLEQKHLLNREAVPLRGLSLVARSSVSSFSRSAQEDAVAFPYGDDLDDMGRLSGIVCSLGFALAFILVSISSPIEVPASSRRHIS